MIDAAVTLLPLLAGAGLLFAGVILLFRQTVTWKHVIILSLGGVLAGISSVQLRVGDDGVTAEIIGQSIGQLKQATDDASTANIDLANAVMTLNMRVGELETALRQTAKSGTPPADAVARAGRLTAEVNRLVDRSRANSERVKDLVARTTVPPPPATRVRKIFD